tara:strand:- start:1055 stop:1645 length:591 start_codon:yes stop_codon:yes gene_type:complete
MIRELHFPTPIYIFDHNNLSINEQLEKNILDWSKLDKGIQRTNVNGWHSTTDMYKKPEYAELVKGLYEAQNIIYQEEQLDSEPYLGSMWANINPPNSMNRAHMHPNSLWSGVYYVKTPHNCGNLKIDDPRSSASMCRPSMKEGDLPPRLYRELEYKAVAGRLIMFPSWLTHCVDTNLSNDIRISVSFNFLQKSLMI